MEQFVPGPDAHLRAGSPGDSIKLSFVFMGCNRIQYEDWDRIKAGDPSSANLPQLQQSLEDISQLHRLPSHLFFTGDLVVNDWPNDQQTHHDVTMLKNQLNAWTMLYKKSQLPGAMSGSSRSLATTRCS